MEDDFLETAFELTHRGRLSEARAVLERALRKRPVPWSPIVDLDDREIVHCWSRSEFLAYVEHRKRSGVDKGIDWLKGSFSQACFQLGWIKLEMGELLPALYAIERGIALEPDHPRLLCEKGHILQRMQRHDEALRYFQRAETARPWAPVEQIAAALRGQGINLIDLGRVGEAREALLKSLGLEPENRNAKQELQYIANNLAELNQRSRSSAIADGSGCVRQYALCTCPEDGTFFDLDSLIRFHAPRAAAEAAAERMAQMRSQQLTAVVRVDKLGQVVGKRLGEAPVFAGRTLSEFEKWAEELAKG